MNDLMLRNVDWEKLPKMVGLRPFKVVFQVEREGDACEVVRCWLLALSHAHACSMACGFLGKDAGSRIIGWHVPGVGDDSDVVGK